jgi:4'-phosphopantetheinyl transferase
MSQLYLDNFPEKPNLSDNEIHIWIANLDQIILRGDEERLPLSERIRADKYHYQIHKNRYLTQHTLLRLIIGHYQGIGFFEGEFYLGEHGKPYLSGINGKDTICFNISNSESMGIFAFSKNREIGVDIEFVRDIPEMDKIVEQIFSAQEKDFFRSLPENRKKKAFYICWTRKEAFLKATGDGLVQSLDKFNAELIPGKPTRLLRVAEDSKIESRWSIQNLKPAPRYVGALAVKSHLLETKRWQWEVA